MDNPLTGSIHQLFPPDFGPGQSGTAAPTSQKQ